MRISKQEIDVIKELAVTCFGSGTKVYLFGSRLYENKKGGDIDLFVTSKEKSNLSLSAKIEFLVELKSVIGEQKIDVILDTDSIRGKKQFYKSVTKEALEL